MKAWLLFACLAPLVAPAQEAEIQRSLIERDRQSAEFSRPELRELHLRQSQDHRPPRADERSLEAREREELLLRAPVTPAPEPDSRPAAAPLPLPGGLRHGVDPVPVQGVGG